MKKRFFNVIGSTILAIIIMVSLLVVHGQENEQDPPGLATVGSQVPPTWQVAS